MGYHNLDALKDALVSKKIEGIAMDNHMVTYFVNHLKDSLPSDIILKLVKSRAMESHSYGLMSKKENYTTFFRTFFMANDDYREVMAHDTMQEHEDRDKKESGGRTSGEGSEEEGDSSKEETNVFDATSRMYVISMVAMLAIGICSLALGFLIKHLRRQGKKIPFIPARQTKLQNGENGHMMEDINKNST